MKHHINRLTATTFFAVIIIGFLILLFCYDPSTAGFYPRCPSKALTGYDCPGCGSLRGMHALLHGDFAGAWRFNAALYFAIPLVCFCCFAGISRYRFVSRHLPERIVSLSQKSSKFVDHPTFPLTILAAIVFWTVFRNL